MSTLLDTISEGGIVVVRILCGRNGDGSIYTYYCITMLKIDCMDAQGEINFKEATLMT